MRVCEKKGYVCFVWSVCLVCLVGPVGPAGLVCPGLRVCPVAAGRFLPELARLLQYAEVPLKLNTLPSEQGPLSEGLVSLPHSAPSESSSAVGAKANQKASLESLAAVATAAPSSTRADGPSVQGPLGGAASYPRSGPESGVARLFRQLAEPSSREYIIQHGAAWQRLQAALGAEVWRYNPSGVDFEALALA